VTSPDPRWRDDWALGDDFVPAGRYTSPEFFALEMERLWPRVWQIAGRQDELRETGDFVEYRIGTQSILVVRTPAGALKAYHNACRHRGRRLASGCGRFEGRTIRCPFHGWAWNLEGENVHVFHGEEFDAGTISRERLQLVECQLDTWGGFVWINMDPSAPPLRQAIGPATRHLDPAALDRMSVLWHKQVQLPVNWKAALDAFVESYHVPTVHPEYPELGTDITQFVYHVDGGGHSHYAIPLSAGGAAPERPDSDSRELFHRYVSYTIDEIGAMYTEKDRELTERLRHVPLPEGSSAGAEYAKALYAHAAQAGIDLPVPTPAELSQLGGNFVFPHFFTLPTLGNALAYRARPIDLGTTLWDVWSLTILPKGEADRPPPPRAADWRNASEVGRVLHQDFSNLAEVWSGMQSRGFDGLRLNRRQEIGILETHRELDRYLRVPLD
jgi:phenylpropionate dioxygenase-like ring-hydroxylating dioxygenase large terminal subunit